MDAQTLLNGKGTRVETVGPGVLASVAIHVMRLRNIGALVVSSDGDHVDGIVTERDLVRALDDNEVDIRHLPVSELMSKAVTCSSRDSIKTVMLRMTQYRSRHLVVTPPDHETEIAGLLSIGDVVKARIDELEIETGVLHDLAEAHWASHS